jgi:methylmalonyl-CoA mutase C-terminal domain/subunit
MKRRIRVLLAKLGLDVHNRGIVTVANQLRNAGMEVVYIGNALPLEIARTATAEDADVIGVSSLGGAHLSLGRQLLEQAAKEGLRESVAFLIGGVFPPADGERLKEIGFDAVFVPGATGEHIVGEIERLMREKAIR